MDKQAVKGISKIFLWACGTPTMHVIAEDNVEQLARIPA